MSEVEVPLRELARIAPSKPSMCLHGIIQLAISLCLLLSQLYVRAIRSNHPGHVQLEAYKTWYPTETPPGLNLFPVFCILYYEIFCRRVM